MSKPNNHTDLGDVLIRSDLNVPMKLLSISQWTDILKKSGLNKVSYLQVNERVDFSGTLILYGRK